MGKWTPKDTARETKVSSKEVARTWHEARENARKSGEIPQKTSKNSDKSGNSSGKK